MNKLSSAKLVGILLVGIGVGMVVLLQMVGLVVELNETLIQAMLVDTVVGIFIAMAGASTILAEMVYEDYIK